MPEKNNPDQWSNMDGEEREERARERADRNSIYGNSGQIQSEDLRDLPQGGSSEGDGVSGNKSPYKFAEAVGKENINRLPDRVISDRNSPYRAAGEIGEDEQVDEVLQDMPDRQMAQRNSPYRAAGELDESGEAQGGQSGAGNRIRPASEGQQQNRSNFVSAPTGNQGRQSRGGNQGGTPLNDQGREQHGNTSRDVSPHSQGGQPQEQWGDKENRLPETVSQNTAPYEGPSKLDAAGAFLEDEDPALRQAAGGNQGQSGLHSGRSDGAYRGEHSQVDRTGGGTTRDWKNMPSSAYQGVAGITDADRQRGEMSTDWDGTAASEHPTAESSGSDIRYRSSGGNVSQGQSFGE